MQCVRTGELWCTGAWVQQALLMPLCFPMACLCSYVILPKDFEKGYKANVKKGDTEFAFYQ